MLQETYVRQADRTSLDASIETSFLLTPRLERKGKFSYGKVELELEVLHFEQKHLSLDKTRRELQLKAIGK